MTARHRHIDDFLLLRLSLVAVWLVTGGVSVWELEGQSARLLADAGLVEPRMVRAVILSGAALDAVLGVWMAFRPSRRAYVVAMLALLGMTLVATWLLPGLWLHPLGPLIKNLPIAAALYVLARRCP